MTLVISQTFGMCVTIQVPEELDKLLQTLDKYYSTGMLQSRVATTAMRVFGGYSTRQKSIAGRVMDRAGKWQEGLIMDHINNDPGDNRLSNLRMVTAKGSAENRRKNEPSKFLPPAIENPGIRTYSFNIKMIVDDTNEDILEKFAQKYSEGSVDYGVKRALIGLSWGKYKLPNKVLAHYGIDVPEGMVIDHIDDNQGNNLLSNLQVITQSQNNQKRVERRKRLSATV